MNTGRVLRWWEGLEGGGSGGYGEEYEAAMQVVMKTGGGKVENGGEHIGPIM